MNEIIQIFIPIIIFLGLVLGYFWKPSFFRSCLIGKSVIVLLTLGAITASIINVPIYFTKDSMFAVNLGGLVIPILISFYLIGKLQFNPILVICAIAIVSLFAYSISYLDPGSGIISVFPLFLIPAFVSIIISIMSSLQRPQHAVAFSFSLAIIGTFIGADMTRLPEILAADLKIGYFGGFGIFDLIFLNGLIALAITLPLVFFRTHQTTHETTFTGTVQAATNKRYFRSRLSDRILAFSVDCCIQLVIFLILCLAMLGSFQLELTQLFSGIWGFTLFWWAVCIHIFYFVIFEWLLGRTPGKWSRGIEVIAINKIENVDNSSSPQQVYHRDFLKIFTRNVLRIFDLILIVFSVFRLLYSSKQQRFGDLFAGTSVIASK
jgi:uncharacterized membrane protein/uncharacterized RDD family membrane protein YckC